ncbi:MAG: calcium/sodium antiporter [Chloroflexi bacterium]|nr:calcium/sodium antiporter [Chloroflexota bacterium]
MDVLTLLLFGVGLVLLVVGANQMVRGASGLAAAVGISPLVIGLTVVALGTSSPELAVTVQASWAGRAGVGLGNVVGSNVFNVLVVLGASALMAPLLVSKELIRRDGPVMVATSVLLLLLALDRELTRLDAALLVAILIGYTGYLIWRTRQDPPPQEEDEPDRSPWPLQVVRVVGGVALLVLGARWLVGGAVAVAEAVGLSEVVIGLTVVAIGTSLPEVATTLAATFRGQRDIAVGNVVGSNIYNLLAVLGLAALVSPAPIPVPSSAVQFDVPVAVGVAGACLLSFLVGYDVTRWEGALFLGAYLAYTTYLILEAINHPALPTYRSVLLPLVAGGLVILLARAVRFWWRRRQDVSGSASGGS